MTDDDLNHGSNEFTAPPVRSLLDLSEKVVIVTGGGSGVGRGVTLRFAEAGARVVTHYHSSAAGAEAVVEAITTNGGRATSYQGDLSDPDAATGLIAHAVSTFGRVDALVNNAGIYPLASVLEMTVEEWDTLMNANLRSVFLCTQATARQIIAQASGGAIVNITSIEAENPAPNHSHYNASKGGVLMYTRAAANELGRHGIRVNAVAPGLIWKDDIEQTWPDGVARWRRAAPLGRLGMPEDIADACLFLVSPAARWITGASLTVDGGVMTHQIY
ncbi:MAG TPA: glucose 1-dehydrogenase [Ktedonobacterales bacterium]|jgi:NAD(P)-dependent dehydrogenase (short-subunit alcohol dehydrogenase family)|nr:glucose 1-dehydrogenase [Ktedonobacterales bacterium]